MIKGILFDLDGTLVDTNELIIKSFQHTFKEFLKINVERQEILNFFGEPLYVTMKRYGGDMEDELTKFYMKYNMEVHDIYTKHIRGALEGIKLLKEKGYKLAIVTSKRKKAAVKGVKFAGMYKYMDTIVTPEDTKEHKPNPQPVYKACEILKLEPSECIMVGDSSYDILCGKNAGAKTALVNYTVLDREELLKLEPEYCIDSIEELYYKI